MNLRLPVPRYAPAVAGDVLLGMALKAGFPALAADRVRRDVLAAVRAAAAPLDVSCEASPGRVRLRLDAGDAAALERAAEALDGYGPRRGMSRLEVDFTAVHRGRLRAV